MCSCSISVPWNKLPDFVDKLLCQVIPIRDDGFCFLQAVCLAVCMDHDEEMSVEKLQSSILNHMEANVDYYQKFHTGEHIKRCEKILQTWYILQQCYGYHCYSCGKSFKCYPMNLCADCMLRMEAYQTYDSVKLCILYRFE